MTLEWYLMDNDISDFAEHRILLAFSNQENKAIQVTYFSKIIGNMSYSKIIINMNLVIAKRN